MNQTALPKNWPAESDWTPHLQQALTAKSFEALIEFIEQERREHKVFPTVDDVFNAFKTTSYADTKVVILGQDPYHGAGQAHGLSFSVLPGVKHPPSLRNIFKELHSDLKIATPETGDLTRWAKQGVMLLNTVLTVRESTANSHRKKGWEEFTDAVIEVLDAHPNPIVFILWGKPAQKKEKLLSDRHHTIQSAHPSPLSAHRGFFDSKPFSTANRLLIDSGIDPIDWDLG